MVLVDGGAIMMGANVEKGCEQMAGQEPPWQRLDGSKSLLLLEHSLTLKRMMN